jgi:hypothetical protein
MSEISPILPCSRSGGPSAAASHAADIDQPSQAQNGSRVELNESAQQLPEEVEVADPLSLLRGFAKVALAMEGEVTKEVPSQPQSQSPAAVITSPSEAVAEPHLVVTTSPAAGEATSPSPSPSASLEPITTPQPGMNDLTVRQEADKKPALMITVPCFHCALQRVAN